MSKDIWWFLMDLIKIFISCEVTTSPLSVWNACADENRSKLSIQIHAERVLSSSPLTTDMQHEGQKSQVS